MRGALLAAVLAAVGIVLLLVSQGAAPEADAAGEARAPSGMTEVGAAAGLVHSITAGGAQKLHIRETMGQGACWLDFDRDGDLDLFLPNGAAASGTGGKALYPPAQPWRFYLQDGGLAQEGRFLERAEALGILSSSRGLDGEFDWGVGCAVGDIDGDGWVDLYVTTAAGPNRLLRNRQGLAFEDVSEGSGTGLEAFSTGALFADLDGDRDLDLFVATYLDEASAPPGPCKFKGTEVTCGPKGFPQLEDHLYLNDGKGRFTEAPESAGIAGHRGFGLSVLPLDADGDGDTDLFVANDSSPNRLFLNRGDATFEEAGLAAGVSLSGSGSSQAGMGCDAGDLDGDGLEDLVVTNFSDDVHNLYRRVGPALFADETGLRGLAQASFFQLGWAAILEDFDLDGDLDLFLANGHVYPGVETFDSNTAYRQPLQLLWNDGEGYLAEDPARLGEIFSLPLTARGAAPADYDGDGDMDLLVVRDGAPPLLLRNDLPRQSRHWLKIRLRGDVASNGEALGARVVVEAGGKRQARELRRTRGYLSGGPAELVFGLGDAERADGVTVHWPAGGATACGALEAERIWIVRESGACQPAGLPAVGV